MKKVVVVGGGIIGLCSAYEISQRGHSVIVVDPTFSEGCSYGNGGIVVPSHFTPLASPGTIRSGIDMLRSRSSPFGFAETPNLRMLSWLARFIFSANAKQVGSAAPLLKRLNLESKNLYKGLIAELGVDVGFCEQGLLMICGTEEALRHEVRVAGQAEKLGLATTTCSSADVHSLEPSTEIRCAGAIWFKDDAHLFPEKLMEAIKGLLRSKGVEFKLGSVSSLVRRGRRLTEAITREGGAVEADEFVICAGVWSSDLAKDLGLRVPMLSGRGYGVTYSSEKLRLNRAAILVEARTAVTPMSEGTRFVGCLELGMPQPRKNTPRLGGMLRGIPLYFPEADLAELQILPVWSGHRPCTPDGLPYLGRSNNIENLVWATGHAMMGMSLGPVTARIVGQIIDGEPLEIEYHLLSPDRYA